MMNIVHLCSARIFRPGLCNMENPKVNLLLWDRPREWSLTLGLGPRDFCKFCFGKSLTKTKTHSEEFVILNFFKRKVVPLKYFENKIEYLSTAFNYSQFIVHRSNIILVEFPVLSISLLPLTEPPRQQRHGQHPQDQVDYGSGHNEGEDVLHLHLLGGFSNRHGDALPDSTKFKTSFTKMMGLSFTFLHFYFQEEQDGDQEVVVEADEGQEQRQLELPLIIHTKDHYVST